MFTRIGCVKKKMERQKFNYLCRAVSVWSNGRNLMPCVTGFPNENAEQEMGR